METGTRRKAAAEVSFKKNIRTHQVFLFCYCGLLFTLRFSFSPRGAVSNSFCRHVLCIVVVDLAPFFFFFSYRSHTTAVIDATFFLSSPHPPRRVLSLSLSDVSFGVLVVRGVPAQGGEHHKRDYCAIGVRWWWCSLHAASPRQHTPWFTFME